MAEQFRIVESQSYSVDWMNALLKQMVEISTFWGIPYVLPLYGRFFYRTLMVEISTISFLPQMAEISTFFVLPQMVGVSTLSFLP